MLTTSEEVRNMEQKAIINGVDNPNLMSVDSTEPFQTDADVLKKEDEEKLTEKKEEKEEKIEEKPDVEKKEEKPAEVKEKQESSKETPLRGADKRIAELTRKFRSTERERDFERGKRQEAEEKLKELSAKIPVVDRPKKEDFDDEESFIEALTDWKIETKLKVSREEIAKTVEEKEEKESVDKTYDELDAVMERGREKYNDFNDLVLAEDLVLSTGVSELVLLSDKPEDVFYYLATHADESAELSTMSPTKAAIRIGVIEAKLEKEEKVEEKPLEEKKEEKPPVKKKQTNAPEPIVPVRTTGVIDKDPSSMTPKEYRAWRERNKE
jgi:hypothetical protein